MKAGEIAVKNFPTIYKDARIKEAILTMSKKRVDRLIVLNRDNTLYGILTEYDILFKLSQRIVKKFQPFNVSVASAATSPVDIAYIDTDVKTIIDMMLRGNYSSLPILNENGVLYGLVTKYEIVRLCLQERIAEKLRNMKARDVMDKARANIELLHRLKEAQAKMKASGFNTLIVTYQGKFVGFISALDIAKVLFIIKKVNPTYHWEYNLSKLIVADIVNRNVKTLNPDDNILSAVNIITLNKQKVIPIISPEDNKVEGVIARRHILKLLIKEGLI